MNRAQREIGQDLHAPRQGAKPQQGGSGQRHAGHPPPKAQGQGAVGELTGDVFILGADQVQHLDGLLVDGETGAGGEDHRAHAGQADEGHDHGGQNLRRADQADQPVEPDPVVVHRGARRDGGQAPRQGRHVHTGAGSDLHVDEAGQGKILDPGRRSQPWFQKGHQPARVQGLGVEHARHRPDDAHGRLQAPVVVLAGGGNLDGEGAAHPLVPAPRHGLQHQHPGQGDDRQINHEGDQPGQETAEGVALQGKVGSAAEHVIPRSADNDP